MHINEVIQKHNKLDASIYLINRSDHKSRLQSATKNLEQLFTTINIVEAYHPNEAQDLKFSFLSAKAYKNISRPTTNTNIIPTWAAAACAMSHIKAWTQALDSEREIVVIVEDDICIDNVDLLKFYMMQVQQNLSKNPQGIWFFNAKLKHVSKSLFYNNYFSQYAFGYEKTEDFQRIHFQSEYSLVQCHFYMTTRSVLIKMLENYYPIEYQIDIHISHVLRDSCNLLIMNVGSDCGVYQNKKRFRSSVQFYYIKTANLLYMILDSKLPWSICGIILNFII